MSAITTRVPEGGTESASLLSLLANAAAKYAGRRGDFKQASRSCSQDIYSWSVNHQFTPLNTLIGLMVNLYISDSRFSL